MSKLAIPTEGPCAGHPCDNCKTCQRGRCCRRDNPKYKLPQLGEWDGPIYGELGVLHHDDGERVECHCCGEWFIHLGLHIWHAHDVTLEEYKAIFGLPSQRGLYSPAKRQHHAALHGPFIGALNRGKRVGASLATREQKSAWASKPMRLGVRLDPSYRNSRLGHSGSKREQRRPKRIKSSPYLGVTRFRNMWRAQLVYRYQHCHLGLFATEEEAARAYDAKARELYGDKARLNFPDEAPS